MTKPYHHKDDGTFRNPKGSPKRNPRPRTVAGFARRMAELTFTTVDVPADHVVPRDQAVRDFNAMAVSEPESLTWLGHAAFLVRMGGLNVVTDPYLTRYAGPRNFGPRRFVKSGLPQKDLPQIDVIAISHNHYDHLDEKAIERFPNKDKIHVVAPLRLGEFFAKRGYSKITELDWEETAQLNDQLAITALPVVHWSRRTGFDQNRTLWAGFALRSPTQHLFFGGDSAYGPVFKEIGERHGPFDIALLGIGAYAPEEIMHASHATPEEAVQMARDMGARRIVGMHWGTVILTAEPPFEPPERFKAAGLDQGYSDEDLWVMKIGETRPLKPLDGGN